MMEMFGDSSYFNNLKELLKFTDLVLHENSYGLKYSKIFISSDQTNFSTSRLLVSDLKVLIVMVRRIVGLSNICYSDIR